MNLHLNDSQLIFISAKVAKIKYRLCVYPGATPVKGSLLVPCSLQNSSFMWNLQYTQLSVLKHHFNDETQHEIFKADLDSAWFSAVTSLFCVRGWAECSGSLSPPGRGSGDPLALQCPERFPLALLATPLNHPSSVSPSAPGKELDTDLKFRGIMPVVSPWDMRTVQPSANEIPWPSRSC